MANYRPELDNTIPLVLLKPTYKVAGTGARVKTFPSVSEALKDANNLFFGNFKTYGGTERNDGEVNGVYSIIDTAVIETWYRPDIKGDCQVGRANDGAVYEIMHDPEDVNQRHQFLKFKVRRVKGGV